MIKGEKVKAADERYAEHKTGSYHFRKEVMPMGM